jgi:hypothetical protein
MHCDHGDDISHRGAGVPLTTASRHAAGDSSSTENVSSPLLPGGDLINAALDRQVMIWSDRGGASRHIGDRWALRTHAVLYAAIGSRWPVPLGEPFELLRVLRLDDDPAISREANHHHLENPDFLCIGTDRRTLRPCLQAVDAKFAADRIKPSQVSADVVRNLLALPGGATRAVVDGALADLGLADHTVVRGVFVVPESGITEHLLRRVTTGRSPSVDPREVVRAAPEPASLFAGLPPSRLIGNLARIDALPVTPRSNVISAVYYLRLACACVYLWGEEHRPLWTARDGVDPEPGAVSAELTRRATDARSAYDLVATWAADVQPQVQAREAIADVVSLPVRMRDIREQVARAGVQNESRVVRAVRRDLEIDFRDRVYARVGEIAADDPRPLAAILSDVARRSRELEPEMRALLLERVRAHAAADSG